MPNVGDRCDGVHRTGSRLKCWGLGMTKYLGIVGLGQSPSARYALPRGRSSCRPVVPQDKTNRAVAMPLPCASSLAQQLPPGSSTCCRCPCPSNDVVTNDVAVAWSHMMLDETASADA